MSRVICNASPIVSLAMIGKAELLWELFDEVYIPRAVYQEVVLEGSGKFGAQELQGAINKGYVYIYDVRNRETVNQLYGALHYGELEVIIGAKELGINIVIMDEKLARRLAETLLLTPIGVLGVLMLAKKKGKVKKVKPLLDALIQSNFRISKKLYWYILDKIDEF